MTTLPCSSYLSSQSTYLAGFPRTMYNGQDVPSYLPSRWVNGFRRSLQCDMFLISQITNTSLLHNLIEPSSRYLFADQYFNCSTNETSPSQSPRKDTATLAPPSVFYTNGTHLNCQAVALGNNFHDQKCCNDCMLHVDQVHLYYFANSDIASICSQRGAEVKTMRGPIEQWKKQTNGWLPANETNKSSNPSCESVATVDNFEM